MARRVSLLAALLVLTFSVGGRREANPAQAQTPPATPQRLPGHVLGALAQATKLAPVPNAGSQPLQLTVVLNRTDEAGFRAFLQDIQDPSSPNFQHFLSQADLTARFGPSQQAYDAVRTYLQQQGFSLVAGSANRLTLTVSGTRAQADAAFRITIGDYQLGSRAFYANDTDPTVPASVAPNIQAIVGLSNLARPEPRLAHAQPGAQPENAPATTPLALAQAYNFAGVHAAAGAGAGETVGLLEFDNYVDSDVASFLSFANLPASLAANVTRRAVDGGTTPGAGGGETEVMLDIETVLGMAQGATIKVYDAPNASLANGGTPIASWQDIYNAMIGDNVDVISSSWGDCEWQHPTADALSLDSILAGGAASGINNFQAIGDHGSNCNDTGMIDPGFPDEDPNVTGVGGTTLAVTSTGAYQSEQWWDWGSDTGQGGFGISCCFTNPSFGFPRPGYETGFTASADRSVPDVSADADPNTGIIVCQADAGGCIQQIGGTSMAAPEWAAGMALIDQGLGHRIGNADTVLYPVSGSSGFHPPSSMQGSATGATNDFAHLGLGSFNLGNLVAAIINNTANAAASTMAPSSQTVTAGGAATGTITVTLLDAASRPVTGKAVSLKAGSGSSVITGPVPATTGANGQAVFTVKDATLESVTYTATDLTDNNLVLPRTAQVQFTPPETGDVNADGSVNATDALCVLRIVALLPSTAGCPNPPPGNPDVNQDNDPPPGADATDALCILRHVALLPGTAACPAFGAVRAP